MKMKWLAILRWTVLGMGSVVPWCRAESPARGLASSPCLRTWCVISMGRGAVVAWGYETQPVHAVLHAGPPVSLPTAAGGTWRPCANGSAGVGWARV